MPDSNSVPIAISGYNYVAEARPGDLVRFVFEGDDQDLMMPILMPQTVAFTSFGAQLGQPWNSDSTGCLTPPCATIVPAPSNGGSYAQVINNRVVFEWTPTCDHLAPAAQGLTREYVFLLRMTDNQCPAPASALRTLRVIVRPDSTQAPTLLCASDGLGQSVDLSWAPPADTGSVFQYYIIEYKADSIAPFAAIDTVANYATTSSNLTGLANSGQGWFRVRAVGACGANSPVSAASRTPLYFSADTLWICGQDSILVDPGVNAGHYWWSTGDTTPTVWVDQSGMIRLQIDQGGCYGLDSVFVAFQNLICPVPNAVVFTDQCTSVQLNWTGADTSVVEYGPAGYLLGTGTRLMAYQNSAVVSGLSSGQEYDFRVADYCARCGDTTDFSAPVEVISAGGMVPQINSVNDVLVALTLVDAEMNFTADADPHGAEYYWDFGNGNQDTGASVFEVYTMGGLYTIQLRVQNACGTQDTTFSIYIPISADEFALTQKIKAFPNPVGTVLHLESVDAATYLLISPTGQILERGVLSAQTEHRLSMEHLAPGVYGIQISTDRGRETLRVVKE